MIAICCVKYLPNVDKYQLHAVKDHPYDVKAAQLSSPLLPRYQDWQGAARYGS